ncbi:hypothetical protein [Marinobacter sp. X15-166B]|uniref:hypothetical protein n=1 Tax=Marinobacter sp. X15-166B TaxID=1897620 RepID=UPI0013018FBE|nr:hypothetical protein [Marinobacter sp. X15-166B]
MILKALTGRALPYVAGATALLVIAMAGSICLLLIDRDRTSQRLGELSQVNLQHAETIRENAAEYADLQAELDRRDALATRAQVAQQHAERKADEITERLRLALQADGCANARHPLAVGDSLRAYSTSNNENGD